MVRAATHGDDVVDAVRIADNANDTGRTVLEASSCRDAVQKAQEFAQVPRVSKRGQEIPLTALNPSSRGKNAVDLQWKGITTLVERTQIHQWNSWIIQMDILIC